MVILVVHNLGNVVAIEGLFIGVLCLLDDLDVIAIFLCFFEGLTAFGAMLHGAGENCVAF